MCIKRLQGCFLFVALKNHLGYNYSSSYAEKCHQKAVASKSKATGFVVLLYAAGILIIQLGEKLSLDLLTNIGIGIISSGLVSTVFLIYEKHKDRTMFLNTKANVINQLLRLIYFNIPQWSIIATEKRQYGLATLNCTEKIR